MQCLFAAVFIAELISGLSAPVENTDSSFLTRGDDYDVSAVVANGFPNSEATFSELQGKYDAGELVDLWSSDAGFFEIESALLPGNGYYASLRADFVINEASGTVTKLEIATAAQVEPGKSRTGMLFAYNWKLEKFEYIRTFRITSADDVQLVEISKNASSYVSENGDVRITFRAHLGCSLGMSSAQLPFRLSVNLIRLKVCTTS